MDRRIAEWAGRQFGVLARWQLLTLGLGVAAIDRRVWSGRLHVIHQGVYAVGHPRIGRSGRLMAAALAFPLGAVLSHRTAAEVWGLLPPTAMRAHVTSAHRSFHGKPHVVLHRVRSLDPGLTTEVDGLPVTTVSRVLLDLATARDTRPLARAWDEAQRRNLLDVAAVEWICANSPGRRVRPLCALIANARDAPGTRSEMEHRFAELIAHRGLPVPAHNVLVEGHLVDAVWIDRRLIVELDSRAYHSGDAAFEADRARDAELMLAGYRVYRITWRRLTREPEPVAAQLRRLLAASPAARS